MFATIRKRKHDRRQKEQRDRHVRQRKAWHEEHVEARPGWWLDKSPQGGPSSYCLFHAQRGEETDPLLDSDAAPYGARLIGHLRPNPNVDEDHPFQSTYREPVHGDVVIGVHHTRDEAIDALIGEHDRRTAEDQKLHDRSQHVDNLLNEHQDSLEERT